MPHPEPEDSRVVSVRLPTTLVQRLDRLVDWHTTHRRRPTTRNAALREAFRCAYPPQNLSTARRQALQEVLGGPPS